MDLHDLKQQHKEKLLYRIDNDKYSSVNASVKRRIVQEVFTCTFNEEECLSFEKIFLEYININGGQSYDKLKHDLITASKRYYEINQYPAIQCMLFCSKCIPAKRFTKKLVETLTESIENMLQYVDFDDFQASVIHIVTQWANWIPQLQVAIRTSYKLEDVDFLLSIYNNMFSDDELFWEVFYMIIRSGKSEFIPIIIDEVISASTETTKNKQIKNIFEKHFVNYFNLDEAIEYYRSKYGKEKYLGTGQRRVENVLNINSTQNEILQKLKSSPPNKHVGIYKEYFHQLKNTTPTHAEYMCVFAATSIASGNLKAEISTMIFELLMDKSSKRDTPVSIIKEMIYRLAFNRYSDAQDFIIKKYGNNDRFIGVVAFYNLYIARISAERFASNFLIEQNNTIAKGYIDSFKKLWLDTKTSKEICNWFIVYLNAILDNKDDNVRFQTDVSTAIMNLKDAIHVNNLLFDKRMKTIFDQLFGFDGSIIKPLIEIDCQIAILDIINRMFERNNIFEEFLFCLYTNDQTPAVLSSHAGKILLEHGRNRIPVKKEAQ